MPNFLRGEGDSFTIYASNPGKLVSTGARGLVRYGFNQHTWGYVPDWYRGLNAKAMRIGAASYSRFVRDGAYPGPAWKAGSDYMNAVVQDCVDAAVADGLDVILGVPTPFPNAPDASWSAFWRAVALANVKNAANVIIEVHNEPNYLASGAAGQYATVLQAASAAIRAVSSAIRIGAPTINASYGAVSFINALMAVPGIAKCFDVGTYHPYYQSPEESFGNDIGAFPKLVDSLAQAQGRFDLEFSADECGYSGAVGNLSAPLEENRGARGGTIIQNDEVSADYYSRLIPITRATGKMRLVTFYALKDEIARNSDPAFTNVQGHFGLWSDTGTGMFLKPAGLVCKDMLPYMHAADAAWMYTRGQDYFVKLQSGANYVLIGWTVGSPHPVNVLVQATQPGQLAANIAGSTDKRSIAFDVGTSALTMTLGRRSMIWNANVPVDFPEFSAVPVPAVALPV